MGFKILPKKRKKRKGKRHSPPHKKWKDEFYVEIFEYARTGMSNNEIAQAIGVAKDTFANYVYEKPALKAALKRARTAEDSTFLDYVYKHLPSDLQEKWDKIHAFHKEKNGMLKVKAMVEQCGIRTKQHLFLYAFCHYSFNPTMALRKLCLSKKKDLDVWVETDPDFAKLLEEVNWHKANFFEDALIRQVKAGEIHAIIFANKTFNRDRGYGEKAKGETEDKAPPNLISIETLNLTLESKKELLASLRKQNLQIEDGRVIPVESREVDDA